ncbi:MAG: hypothetical protein ACJA0X_003122, partial [Cyclobacteriaceae bacterium]
MRFQLETTLFTLCKTIKLDLILLLITDKLIQNSIAYSTWNSEKTRILR